jgi:hypothetical protein
MPPTEVELADCGLHTECGDMHWIVLVKNPYAWFISMYEHPYEME